MNTTQVKERPVLFSGEMVKAILAGRKTQTRRVVAWSNSTVLGYPAKTYWPNLHFDLAEKRNQSLVGGMGDIHLAVPWRHPNDSEIPLAECGKYAVRPKWEPGDRLWVRETFYVDHVDYAHGERLPKEAPDGVDEFLYYPADADGAKSWCCHLIPECSCGSIGKPKARSSIHMPRWASRITLEVTGVRVERVQDIDVKDAAAEGWDEETAGQHPYGWYRDLWESINGKGSWAANPWVWAVSFKVFAPAPAPRTEAADAR